jgi:site-specific recombinase XerD
MQLPPKKLLDQVRDAICLKHYAYRTEETYVQWIRRYIVFHNKRHPKKMGKAEIEAFLTYLAVEGQFSASTQNQALSALLFLYREVLNLDIAGIDAVRAKRPQYVPTVLTKAEAIADNSSTHEATDEVKAALAAVGAQLIFLPPYSPDLSPIKPFWSKVKGILKSVGA